MRIIFILFLLSCVFTLNAQISQGGMPYSFHQSQLKALSVVPNYKLKEVNTAKLSKEDSENPSPYRYSTFEEVNIDIKTGVATQLNDPQGTIWRYSVSSESGYSIQLFFKAFKIPEGAKLFIYNSDYSIVYGAFTNENMEDDFNFTIADFPGQNLIIEYFEPYNAAFKGTVQLGSIGQAYKDILDSNQDNSFIDINCDEGKNWQNEKHAVCKITFRVGTSGYVCSGALINNTANNGTPYFLTANHCISDTTVAKTLVAYFNYEKKSCNGVVNNYRTLSGSRMLSTGDKSDYTLLRLNNTPSASLMPYYAGWDIGNYQDNQNTSIHHPEGIEKKISIDYDQISTYDQPISWDQGVTTPASTHWFISFDKGSTSEGSSGGPLFSKQKKIIGQLHGGGEGEEFYGKLSYSWTANNSGFSPLKTYLDPNNSGVTSLNGYFPATNFPDAFFTSSFNSVCLNSPVTLTDYSAFDITSRKWTITPSGYSFVNGTTETSAKPEIQFNTATNYTIKLTVNNKNNLDSLQVSNAISVGKINVSLTSNQGNTLCLNQTDSIVLTGLGAENFTWTLDGPAPNPFSFSSIVGDTAILKYNKTVQVDSTYRLNVNLAGTMGTCSANSQQTITFLKPFNDNIANAIELSLGDSKTFSNECATIELNEPVPPADTCTGIKSWCDEYGNGKNIVENSVWFKFKGPATGKAGLRSFGFDNEIAIYEANTYQDILTGNFKLLAANDDESDENPNPAIGVVTVQPGKMYWIQVDGSGGGSVGTFTLTLADKNITAAPDIIQDNSMVIYPQPATDILTIKSVNFGKSDSDIKVYNLSGKVFIEKNIKKNSGTEVNLEVGNLYPGIYLLKITQNNKSVIKKFIKN